MQLLVHILARGESARVFFDESISSFPRGLTARPNDGEQPRSLLPPSAFHIPH